MTADEAKKELQRRIADEFYPAMSHKEYIITAIRIAMDFLVEQMAAKGLLDDKL